MKIPKLVFTLLLFLPLLSNANSNLKIDMDRENELINFLDIGVDGYLSNMAEMEKKNLKTAEMVVTPWVGNFWPLSKGMIAHRYADLTIERNGPWNYYLNNFNESPPMDYIKKGKIDLLSPAEKYDLLLGDVNFSLTKKMWAWGKMEMDKYSQIKGWAGIGHGLALASLKFPNPLHSIKIWSIDKKYIITFTPDDIKAIGSMFYSLGTENPRTMGQRCREENPQLGNNGRLTTEECFDLNPGKFHIALVNQIGLAQKSFVMDVAYNEPIWHYPVVGYRFEYFNLKKPYNQANFESALIKRSKFENDPFSAFRSGKTEFLIGIRAQVLSASYKNPGYAVSYPKPKIFDYEYELELDKDLNIVGGEWRSKERPDFIWQTAKDFSPITDFEEDMYNPWDPQREFLPDYWAADAIKASSKGIIVSPIVNGLFWLSANGKNGYKTL